MSCPVVDPTLAAAAATAILGACLAVAAGAVAYVAKTVDEWRRWRR